MLKIRDFAGSKRILIGKQDLQVPPMLFSLPAGMTQFGQE